MVIVRKVINMSYKTNLTRNKREQLKSQMDDFATFQWRGHDMWEDYGCFIINESKGSLKFYNGPGYSNKYAKPQFSSSVNTLIGVDFKQKTIPMKIGMYWFTIEEYQEFLNEIGPYVINYLTFGYEKNYGYLVKLANIADSPRHVIGTNEDGNYVYYTEMDLTWELLGDNCVRSNLPYEYNRKAHETGDGEYTWELDNTYSDMKDPSQLDTPLLLEIPLRFTDDSAVLQLQAINNIDYLLNENGEIDPVVRTTPIVKELFNIRLKDLTYSDTSLIEGDKTLWEQYTNIYQMLLRYDSETGLLYIQEGVNDTWHLLNYQTNNSNGDYILQSAVVNKWKIPGSFSAPFQKTTDWQFKLTTTNVDISLIPQQILNTSITVYARKNIV